MKRITLAGMLFLTLCGFAPLDRPAPAPEASQAELKASLACSGDLDDATRAPVLLVPATTVNSRENFGWNYVPYFKQLGIPYCTTDLPGERAQNMGDIQQRGDYIAYAIRQMFARAHRRIAILGHSQGGMVMRWALRFWPDTRDMVDDVIGMAGTNHGSVVVPAICIPNCAAALWQQSDTANFYKALNSGQETFAGISYTEIYSHADEFVQPNLDSNGTSSLHTGPGRITNVAIQDICPLALSEHLLVGTTDPVASALVIDALNRDGPAVPAAIDRGVCNQRSMPGVDAATGIVSLGDAGTRVATQLAGAKRVATEPPLACYTTDAGCPGRQQAVGAAPAACTAPKRLTLRLDRFGFHVTRVTVAGKRLRITRRNRRRVAVVDLRRAGATVRVRITGGARSATRTYRVCA
jgi:triacylglycerol esterase/lipase EstA (alpha/beta hydrolase family)